MGHGPTNLRSPDSILGSTDTFVARGLRLLWGDRRIAIAVAVAVPALVGLLSALAMARGPITTTQALVTMVADVLTGGSVGLVLRSRWAMALAPAVFVAVYEMVRIGSSGPTVDAMHADVIGIIAIIVGRGVHGILALVPMILGAAYGAALARRWCGISPGEGRNGIFSARADRPPHPKDRDWDGHDRRARAGIRHRVARRHRADPDRERR